MRSMTAVPTRIIEFEACFNCRDLGGYQTTDGRSVRWGRLYRADTLHRLTDDDLIKFHALGLRTVIDLRSTKEIDDFGSMRVQDDRIELHHIPMMDVVDLRSVQSRPPSEPLEDPVVAYHRIFGNGHAVVRAFEVLSGSDRLAALFHCTAGKDRTGILAAMILDVLGVPDEVIVADYQLTDEARQRSAPWIEKNEPELAAFYAQLTPELRTRGRDGLVGLLSALRAKHGSIEGMLLAIGATATVIDALRDALLER
jgi:protein-tyrosine phosphatase